MSQELWSAVDDFFAERLGVSDPALEHALAASAAARLPAISVSPLQGCLLHLLALSVGARRILEVGTLGGYSTIHLARALPEDGQLVTLELDPHHADVARANLAQAGVGERVEVRVGAALETLPQLEAEGAGPFDFVFIDADKPGNPHYVRWALKLARPGSLIVVDNTVRGGRVIEADGDASVQGVHALLDVIAAEARLTATAVQTVGVKGYDGFILARVQR
jgi:predicted O-methyltransferase YrrM